MIQILVALFAFSMFSAMAIAPFLKVASANTIPPFDQIADAIYWAEGKNAHTPYGIESETCYDRADCRQICINTIRNNYDRWLKSDRSISYLEFLARKYCPFNWQVWLKNVQWFVANPEAV